MARAHRVSVSVALGALLAACGLSVQGFAPDDVADAAADANGGGSPDGRGGADTGLSPTQDGALDGSDGGGSETDASADASRDAGADAALDSGADAALDSGSDAGPLALRALELDGVDDFVRMPRPVADNFTLEAWIRTTVSGAGPNFWDGPPVFHADIDGANSDFGSAIQNGKLSFGMGPPDLTVVGATNVATGSWIHVAVTRVKSTGTVTLYVNGVQDAQRTGMSSASLSANPQMDIGANLNNHHFFKGTIDEVRAWNIVRTGSQIAATMKTRLAGDEPGLVGYWRFDEASGDAVTDDSPTHASGSLGGGTAGARPARVTSTAF